MTPEEEFAAGVVAPKDVPSRGASFGRGVVKGATLGLSTPAAGSGAAAAAWLTRALPGVAGALGFETRYPEELPTTKEAFQEAAQQQAAGDEAARQAHPGAFFGGQLAGGVLPSVIGGGAGLARNVAQGGIQGAISGAAEASPSLDAAEMAKGAGVGGLIGGVTGTIPTAISKVGQTIRHAGERAGIRALGLTGQQVRALAKESPQTLEVIRESLSEMPHEAGIRLLGNPAANAQRLGEVQKRAGKFVGDIVSEAEDKAVPMYRPILAKKLQSQIAEAAATPGVDQAYVNALKKEARNVLRGDREDFGPRVLHVAMKKLGKRAEAVYSNTLGAGERAKASAAADTRKVLEGVLDEQVGSVGLGPEFESFNRVYGGLRSLWKQVKPRGPQEELGNRTLALPATMAVLGGIGGAVFGEGDAGERATKALEMAAAGASLRRASQLAANTTALTAPVLSRALSGIGSAPAAQVLSRSLGQALVPSHKSVKKPLTPEEEFTQGVLPNAP